MKLTITTHKFLCLKYWSHMSSLMNFCYLNVKDTCCNLSISVNKTWSPMLPLINFRHLNDEITCNHSSISILMLKLNVTTHKCLSFKCWSWILSIVNYFWFCSSYKKDNFLSGYLFKPRKRTYYFELTFKCWCIFEFDIKFLTL